MQVLTTLRISRFLSLYHPTNLARAKEENATHLSSRLGAFFFLMESGRLDAVSLSQEHIEEIVRVMDSGKWRLLNRTLGYPGHQSSLPGHQASLPGCYSCEFCWVDAWCPGKDARCPGKDAQCLHSVLVKMHCVLVRLHSVLVKMFGVLVKLHRVLLKPW